MPQIAAAPRPALIDERYSAHVSLARNMMSGPTQNRLLGIADFGPVTSERKPFGFVDGLAIIGVYGYLDPCWPYIGSSYITGYDALRWQLGNAFEDPDVKGIVLDLDSYGGMVAGCFDLCDWIVATKAKAGKKIVAICSETAYSAAYALAACADSITVPRTGGVGSIGIMIMHFEVTGALEKWGEKVTIIRAGSHKAEGNPYEALTDDVKASLQQECEATRTLFAQTVVAGRKTAGSSITVEQVLATEARTFDGPERVLEAVKIGLADAVMAPADAFAAFRDAVNS